MQFHAHTAFATTSWRTRRRRSLDQGTDARLQDVQMTTSQITEDETYQPNVEIGISELARDAIRQQH
jgi:hypothetical protein